MSKKLNRKRLFDKMRERTRRRTKGRGFGLRREKSRRQKFVENLRDKLGLD